MNNDHEITCLSYLIGAESSGIRLRHTLLSRHLRDLFGCIGSLFLRLNRVEFADLFCLDFGGIVPRDSATYIHQCPVSVVCMVPPYLQGY
jgi:hypothetical protein